MKTKLSFWIVALAILSTCNTQLYTARAQGTAFTFQGSISDGSSLANGIYELRFGLYDAANNGNQMGSLLTNAPTSVANGLFLVTLDFGNQFPGADRWLEMGVRTNGSSSDFNLLAPRQKITPTPYAITASNAINATTALSAGNSGTANNFSGTLSGDVWGSQNSTVVQTVGGQSAGNIASAVAQVSSASINTMPNTLVLRDGAGNIAGNLIGSAASAGSVAPGATIANVFITNSVFAGDGGGLTNLVVNTVNGFPPSANNTPNTLVVRDGAGNITGNLNGNAATATTADSATAANNFSGFLTGDVWGSQNSTVVQTVGGQSAGSIASAVAQVSSASINNTPNTLVLRDGAGNITGSFAGDGSGLINVTGLQGPPGPPGPAGGWELYGNSGTSPTNGNFLGTTDDNPLEFWVNNGRALRLEPGDASSFIGDGNPTGAPNVIGGSLANTVQAGVVGATIGGGGATQYNGTIGISNSITADFGTISGGAGNTASGNYATVAGGATNVASGQFSFAAGQNAVAQDQGSFVWADSEGAPFTSSGQDTFNVRAQGGVYITTAPSYTGLWVDNEQVLTTGYSGTAYYLNAGTASLAYNVALNSITSDNIASGQVVKSVNGLTDAVTLQAGQNITISRGVNTLTIDSTVPPSTYWSLNGNRGTSPGDGDFVGTTDNQPLEFDVNSARALRLEPDATGQGAPNVIGGSTANFVSAGVQGASIGGGGALVLNENGGAHPNSVTGQFGTVGGGFNNTASYGATVGGGAENSASANNATIGGGVNNVASDANATVAGGGENQATAPGAFVGGGGGNLATNQDTTIGGGYENIAGDQYATVGGGDQNYATGYGSTVAGGVYNQATNLYATVVGGYRNVAGGYGSLAAGTWACATNKGAFVWADSQAVPFNSTTNDQASFRCENGVVFTSAGGGAYPTVSWTPGAGAWLFTSDRNAKENFKPLDVQTVLDKVAHLPLTEWNYKGYGDRHVGPMAQDFHAAFPFNNNDKMLNSADEAGVSLAAIQGLNQKLDEKDAEIQELKARLEKLEELVTAQMGGQK